MSLPKVFDKLATQPTISTTREALLAYWDELPHTPGEFLPELDQFLDPLDGFLLHQLLEYFPSNAVVIDLAAGTTKGATTATVLSQSSSRRILTAVAESQADSVRAFAKLLGRVAPEFLATPDLPGDLATRHELVILADARTLPAAEFATAIQGWLEARPDATVIALEVGNQGECGSADELLTACRPGSGRRFWLARELAESLVGSKLAVLARHGNAVADNAVARLAQAYTGNVRYIDLLWDLNREAIRSGGADRLALETHPLGGPIQTEINTAKHETNVARHEMNVAIYQLGVAIHDASVSKYNMDVAIHEANSARYYLSVAEHELRVARHELSELQSRMIMPVAITQIPQFFVNHTIGYRTGLLIDRVVQPLRWSGRKLRRGWRLLRSKVKRTIFRRQTVIADVPSEAKTSLTSEPTHTNREQYDSTDGKNGGDTKPEPESAEPEQVGGLKLFRMREAG